MYEYVPKRKNKKAAMTTLLFSAIAAICFFGAGLFGDLASVVQLLSLIALAVAILVAGRHLLKEFVYRLEESEDGIDLTVTEVQGRRRTVVCRIGLDEIREAVWENAENRSEMKARLKEVKCYDYCIDLMPDTSLYLFFEDRERETAVRLSPDETLDRKLRERIGRVGAEESEAP